MFAENGLADRLFYMNTETGKTMSEKISSVIENAERNRDAAIDRIERANRLAHLLEIKQDVQEILDLRSSLNI